MSTSISCTHQPTSGETWNVLGELLTCRVRSADTGGAYAVVDEVTPPGMGPPLHVHQREQEVFCILRGTYEFTIGNEKRTASAGDVISAPRGVPHTFRNVGKVENLMVITLIPGGFERFFEEVNVAGADHPLALPEVVAIARQYGLEFL